MDCVRKEVHTVDIFDVLDTYSSLSKSITVLANFPNPVVIPYTTVGKKTAAFKTFYYEFIITLLWQIYEFIIKKMCMSINNSLSYFL
jgi:hypothetical protein